MPGTAEDRLLVPGTNCWRVESTRRFSFIVDADAYFRAAREAMCCARRSIFLIGWDFDARIELGHNAEDGGPPRVGDFFLWLAHRNPELEIRLLRWDTGAIKAMFRGNTLLTVLRWKAHRQITLKLDGAHPLVGSHHQKIVVIDDALAFCGGIDMTIERWDRREHADDDPARVRPDGSPHDPWHDATSVFDGDAARAMGDLARDRWQAATGETLRPVDAADDCWPPSLAPTFSGARLGIARTVPEVGNDEAIHEIEQASLDLIAHARRFLYVENQYFASRRIARAIAGRLAEPDGPEIVIVNPRTAEGWLEPLAMDTARARLHEALHRMDRHGRFRILHPRTRGGADIYVHAKVIVVDDAYLRVGSSNFNNRSLGLDSECDVIVAADEPGNESLRPRIAAIRDDLVAEHLGVEHAVVADAIERTGSLIAAIETLRGPGRSLTDYRRPELDGIEDWLADNQILDPEGPDQIFETQRRRGLFHGWRLPWKRGR